MSAIQRRTYAEVIEARKARGRITPADAKAAHKRYAKGMLVNEERAADRKAKAKAGRIEG